MRAGAAGRRKSAGRGRPIAKIFSRLNTNFHFGKNLEMRIAAFLRIDAVVILIQMPIQFVCNLSICIENPKNKIVVVVS